MERSLEPLFKILRRRGAARARELAAELGVSQPTLSRMIRTANNGIVRLGKARATWYALPRFLAGLATSLPVYSVNEAGRVGPYGSLQLLAENRSWLQRDVGEDELFTGLPPFAWDMAPQGYLGHGFSRLHPHLALPGRLVDWNDDHRLIALVRRGEDCVGNLILGAEALERFLASDVHEIERSDYVQLAAVSASDQTGSSAGGEMPKFCAFVEGRHVLVKFAGNDEGAAAQRWRDLLVCENIALDRVRAAGIPAARSHSLEMQGMRFLEVERFDRVGRRGRKGVVSLFALNVQHYGAADNWTKAAQRFLDEPCAQIAVEDLRRLRWLDTFGDLIGNTDRHFGNIAFYTNHAAYPTLELAPVYDMLPMVFAPVGANLVERDFRPSPPNALNLDVWPDAAEQALVYWNELANTPALSQPFRERCEQIGGTVRAFAQRHSAG